MNKNDRVDYLIDLRTNSIDVETAAIIAAYSSVVFLVENKNDAKYYLDDSPDDFKINIFIAKNFSVTDVYSILSFRVDMSKCQEAAVDDNLNLSSKIIFKKSNIDNFILEEKNGTNDLFYQHYLSKHASKIRDEFDDLLLKKFVFDVIVAIENISLREMDVFCGGSGLTDIDINKFRLDSYKESLKLRELSELMAFYNNVVFDLSIPKYVRNLVLIRKAGIKTILDSFYDSNGNLSTYVGFPVIYKYLSAYLIICAKYKSYFNMFSSSFLFLFRSLDWACDGLLIMEGVGNIEPFKGKNDEFVIIDKANGNKKMMPLGFKKKWDALKIESTVVSIPSIYKNKIDEYIKVRNKHLMTHGLLKMNNSYYNDFKSTLIALYSEIDIKTNASINGFSFSDVNNAVEDIFSLNYSDFLFDSLIKEFGLDFIVA